EGAERGERRGRDAVQAQLGQRARDREREAGPVGDGREVGEPAFREDEVHRTRRDGGEREAGCRCTLLPRQSRRREAHGEPIERQANGAEAGARRDGGGAHEAVARCPARAEDEHLRVTRMGREPRGGGGDTGRRVGADDETGLAAQRADLPYSPSSRAMIVSWISVVPSVMVMRRASRQKRST